MEFAPVYHDISYLWRSPQEAGVVEKSMHIAKCLGCSQDTGKPDVINATYIGFQHCRAAQVAFDLFAGRRRLPFGMSWDLLCCRKFVNVGWLFAILHCAASCRRCETTLHSIQSGRLIAQAAKALQGTRGRLAWQLAAKLPSTVRWARCQGIITSLGEKLFVNANPRFFSAL